MKRDRILTLDEFLYLPRSKAEELLITLQTKCPKCPYHLCIDCQTRMTTGQRCRKCRTDHEDEERKKKP